MEKWLYWGAVQYKRDRLPPGVARNGCLGENKNRIKIYRTPPDITVAVSCFQSRGFPELVVV